MGAISECIRNLPGARRSIAYRHSLSAVGPKAGTIVDVNPVLSVFDMESSFGRLLALDAKIALLGLTYVSCTSYHFGEYLVQIPCRETVKRQVLLKKPGGALEPMTLLDYQPSPTDDGREYDFPMILTSSAICSKRRERCAWEISEGNGATFPYA